MIGDLQPPTEPIDGPIFEQTDAGDWHSLLALFKKAEQLFGRIDIVVPNAGFGDRGDFFDHKDDNGDPVKPEFDCMKVTLIGQMYTVKLAMHFMRKQQPQGGVIVSTVSRSGYDCQSIPVYAVSKHGMIGLMRGLRNHTPFWNIRINSIAPHVTDTAAVRRLPTLVPDLLRVGIPVSSVEETARAAAFLAASEDYNGCTISIMGSEYRELESGVERHKVDVMGDDPRFRMNAEQQEVMGRLILAHTFKETAVLTENQIISSHQLQNGSFMSLGRAPVLTAGSTAGALFDVTSRCVVHGESGRASATI